MDGAGGDCTPMWESYHPLAMAKQGPFQKYWIGMVQDYHDFYSWDGKFYDVVKERVEKIVPHELRRYDNRMYVKFWVIIISFVYTMYLYIAYHTWWAAVIFALVSSQVGVNIMHDGNHMAFSAKKWLNKVAGFSLELLGTSAIIYK